MFTSTDIALQNSFLLEHNMLADKFDHIPYAMRIHYFFFILLDHFPWNWPQLFTQVFVAQMLAGVLWGHLQRWACLRSRVVPAALSDGEGVWRYVCHLQEAEWWRWKILGLPAKKYKVSNPNRLPRFFDLISL